MHFVRLHFGLIFIRGKSPYLTGIVTNFIGITRWNQSVMDGYSLKPNMHVKFKNMSRPRSHIANPCGITFLKQKKNATQCCILVRVKCTVQLITQTADANIIRYYTVISITWRFCILSVDTKQPHQISTK